MQEHGKRTDPYRLFFPLGIILGSIGVSIWPLYYYGVTEGYSGRAHAFVQTNGFLYAFIVGFLLTAIPRFTGTEAPPRWAQSILAAVITVGAVAFEFQFFAAGHTSFVVAHIILLGMIGRRFARRSQDPPEIFPLVGIGLMCGMLAALINAGIGWNVIGPQWDPLGKRLITEGMVLLLVLGVGGFLGPRLLGFAPLPQFTKVESLTPKAASSKVLLYKVAGLTVLLSLVSEYGFGTPLMAFARAVVVSCVILTTLRPWRLPLVRSTLTWAIWFAQWFIISAVWLVAIAPRYRVDLLHILFIGGFTLLIVAIGTRVTLSHGGHALTAELRSWPLRVAVVCGFVALAARIAAPFSAFTYFAHLAWASAFWIGGIMFWGFYVIRLIRHRPGPSIRISAAVVAAIAGTSVFLSQGSPTTPLNDPIAVLGRQIEQGKVKLEYSPNVWGYLPSLIKHLDLNVDSQILVFSKTSFQLSRISPKTPRAIYFNDSVAIGAVQDGNVFEFTSFDPAQGLVFYTMDTKKTETPRFERKFSECLNCHGPAKGLIVSSVYPAADGSPFVTGSFFEGINHRTPIENRWGGWYVSGTHGSMSHIGNAIAPDPDRPFDLEMQGTQNLTSLDQKFDTTKYLTSTSDIVALMTIDHQAEMTNLITGAGQQFRQAANNGTLERSKASLDRAVERIIEYMLFVDEAMLRDPMQGVSTFAQTFPQRGPRDKRGRSLRDFDLRERLFRYPLSYMIYSDIFDALPSVARDRIYRRLYEVLAGNDPDPKFGHLAAADRTAILEILLDTKMHLPDYWNRAVLVGSR